MNIRRPETSALLLSLLLLAGCASTTAVRQKPPLSEKEKLADALLAIEPPVVMFAQLSDPHAAPYASPQRREQAHASFMRNVDDAAVDEIIRRALLRHFTEEELRALVAFYSTPEGRACMAKTAAFAAEVVPACAHEAAKAWGRTAVEAGRGRLLQNVAAPRGRRLEKRRGRLRQRPPHPPLQQPWQPHHYFARAKSADPAGAAAKRSASPSENPALRPPNGTVPTSTVPCS